MKKYAIVFLSLLLVVSLPFAAHANIVTATGKYIINAVKHAPGGAKVHATDTVTGAKHVIKHGVSSADLGKSIGAGIVGFGVGTGAGLAFKAITGLALDAVDWVMDPANNRLIIKNPPTGTWYGINGACSTGVYSTPEALCAAHGSTLVKKTEWPGDTCGGSAAKQIVTWYSKPNCSASDFKGSSDTYVSYNQLAEKIIELADAGNPVAQKTIEDYVTNLAKEGKLDNELDNSTDITKPEGTEPEPEPPIKCPSGSVKVDDVCVKIPDSDDDKPLFCDSSEFTKKVCDWIDWTQEEHDELEPDAGKVDITDKSKDLNIDQNRIDFSNQCPAPTPINTSVGGFPISTELNYQPLCDFFTMLNPFVIGMGGISSALIIAAGVRRG